MAIVNRTEAVRLVFGSWKIADLISGSPDGLDATFLLNPLNAGTNNLALRVANMITIEGDKSALPKEKQSEYETFRAALRQNSVNELKAIMDSLGNNAFIVKAINIAARDFKELDSFGLDLHWTTEHIYNVRTYMSNGIKLSEGDVIKIGKDICSALILAHDNGIIHRNIKPDTIYVGQKNYKLGDFGITDTIDNIITANKFYAAPGQIEGTDYTNLVDIYSLGLSLYEMCGGKIPPFVDAKNAIESNQIHKWNSLPLIKNVNSDLLYVINKACSYDISERYQSAQEFKAALDSLDIEPSVDVIAMDASSKSQAANPAHVVKATPVIETIPKKEINKKPIQEDITVSTEEPNQDVNATSANEKKYTAEEVANLFKGRKIVHSSEADTSNMDATTITASKLLELSNGNKFYYLSSPYMTIIDDLSEVPAATPKAQNTPERNVVKKSASARIFTSEEEENKAFEESVARQAVTAARYTARPAVNFGETTVLDASMMNPAPQAQPQPQAQQPQPAAQNSDAFFRPIPPSYQNTPGSVNSANNPMGGAIPMSAVPSSGEKPKKKFPLIPVIIAVLALLLVFLLAVIFLGGDGEDPNETEETTIEETEETKKPATTKETEETEPEETEPSETEPTPTPEVFTPASYYAKSYNKIFGEEVAEDIANKIGSDLESNTTYGGIVIYNLFTSKEYASLNKTDEEYINDVYNVLFGRLPADEETAAWVEQFANGVTHEDFFQICANAPECELYATQHKVECGAFLYNCNQTKLVNVNRFVVSMYEGCLERRPDQGSQFIWVSALVSGESLGRDIASALIQSAEFQERGLDDAAFVKVLYNTYFNREPDEEGFNYWVEQLANETVAREDLLLTFADSPEFIGLCENYNVAN